MGVSHKVERQNSLELAFKKREKENIITYAKIEPEPDNVFAANAIRVLIDYGFGFKHVGYIAQELSSFTQLSNNKGFNILLFMISNSEQPGPKQVIISHCS